MKDVKLISWNVNGIRALVKKQIFKEQDFFGWLASEAPDILCLQETKAHPDQLDDTLLNPPGYHTYWSAAERKGYSGVVVFTKEKPLKVSTELGVAHLDNEGRHVLAEYPNFVIINSYFPNGKKNKERLDYKMEYYQVFFEVIEKYQKKGKAVIFCGDVNTAHKEIDLTHPKANEKFSGFLPSERAWIDELIEAGYIDTLRHFVPDEAGHHSWWSMRSIGAQEKNVGWRLDYFFVSEDLKEKMVEASIMTDVYGSDHCPIGLKLKW